MKKYLITTYLLLLISTNITNADNLNKKDKVAIRKLITKTLKRQNNIRNNNKNLNKKDLLNTMPKYVIYTNKKYSGKEYIKKLSNRAKNLKKDGIKTINFLFQIKKIDCIYLNSNSVNCYVKEIVRATFISKENSSYKLKGQENINLQFRLKMDNNHIWHINEERIINFESMIL